MRWTGLSYAAMAIGISAAFAASTSAQIELRGTPRADPRLDRAKEILAKAPAARKEPARVSIGPFALSLTARLGGSEAFSISRSADGVRIAGGGPAGVLYGAQEAARRLAAGGLPIGFHLSERPDFELRGVALFLMKNASYDYQLTPQEFPWFYDRALLTRYLDYLFENRFNTIFLWSGNLFPSILEMPQYPDSTDLAPEQLRRNQEQFRWFTSECARRNIKVLLHFYNIHLPLPLAKSRGIPAHYFQPNDFAARYMRYVLTRFLKQFESVGLYVCPGEILQPKYQPEWIRDVIFAAAKDSGHDPVIVVRDWTLDAARFKQICVGRYDNLYTELKHNIEMLLSPVPDPRHKQWKDVARKHIVNLHEIADLKPFRWGSASFIRETALEWKKVGLDGAEIYPMTSWRWPYTVDKLEPSQKGFWPQGPKLLTFERDAVWLEAFGRYLWRADRDPETEATYWTKHLAAKFGNEKAGDLLRRWYETSGPVLPNLQNLTSVRNMNFYPTAIGKEQTVAGILNARTATETLANQAAAVLPSRPVDTYFLERYRVRYHEPALTNRVSMPVSVCADRRAAGEETRGVMTPDRVARLLVEMAEESVDLARQAQAAASKNQDEAARFVTDSEALALVARVWEHKVDAALFYRMWERTGNTEHRHAFLSHVEDSVKVYEQLVELTDRTYLNPTDMLLTLNWHAGLDAFRAELKTQRDAVRLKEIKADVLAGPQEARDMLVRYFERMSAPRHVQAKSLKDWQRRRAEVRRRVLGSLGLDPLPARLPLDVSYGGSLDRGDYVVRRVYFQTWPRVYASAWLYLPKTPGRHPAILLPHGHWALGATDPVMQTPCICLAKKGYVVLMTDAVHFPPDGPSYLIGACSATAQIWNLMRGADFLETLPEVDPAQMGCAGASGGGLQTLYVMAGDDRIKAAAPAVYVSYFRTILTPSESAHCWCNWVPGLLSYTDAVEIAATFAPRPALYLTVDSDWTARFPQEGFQEIQRVYALYGKTDRTDVRQWSIPHDYPRPMRESTYAWFNKWLKGIDDPAAAREPDVQVENQETLRALDKPPAGARGLEAILANYETNFRAAPPDPEEWRGRNRRAASPGLAQARHYQKNLRHRLLELLGDGVLSTETLAAQRTLFPFPRRLSETLWRRRPAGEAPPAAAPRRSGELVGKPQRAIVAGLPAEKWRVRSEPEIIVPALLFRPTGPKRAPLVILLHPRGKSYLLLEHEPLVKALVEGGAAVFLPDLRPTGELAHKWDANAVIWGRPYPGVALSDLRACLDVLTKRRDVDRRRVVLAGLGEAGVTALLIGALDPRVTAVMADDLGRTYREGRVYPLITNIKRVGDLPEIAAALAPRSVWAGGARDPAYEFTRQVYGVFNSSDKVNLQSDALSSETLLRGLLGIANRK